MTTLIIPCGGKSSRFPNMKPKWLLTHPDGSLMIEKAINCLHLQDYQRIIVTIISKQQLEYEAELILHQALKNIKNLEVCILDEQTSCAAETVSETIKKMKISGSIVVKDSDNSVIFTSPKNGGNYIVSYDIIKHPDVSNIPGKSFVKVNEQDIVLSIVEKTVVSNRICLGVYAFSDASQFQQSYEELKQLNLEGELYLSQVISFMIDKRKEVFYSIEAADFQDWGTLKEWRNVQCRMATYFCDIDGVLFYNRGKYGSANWDNCSEPLIDNIATVIELQKNGAQIIMTTSRPEVYRESLLKQLESFGIRPYAIIMGLNHAPRVVINDFANTNPYPSCLAVNIPRTASLKEYIK